MSNFFEDTMQGLQEAIAINKGEILIVEKADMPEAAFVAADIDKIVVDVKGRKLRM